MTPGEAPRKATLRGGVVLVPEVFGIDEPLRDYARRLEAEGYRVAMPDPWEGRTPPPMRTPAELGAAVAMVDDGRMMRAIARSLASLGVVPSRVVMGFCLGGLHARMAAAVVPGFDACVEFYGRIVYPSLTAAKPIQPLDLLPGRRCPYLGHFGAEDPVAPPHHVDELEARLAQQSVAARVHRYPGCGHAFLNPRRPTWNADAAALAWSRTLRFLEEVLPEVG